MKYHLTLIFLLLLINCKSINQDERLIGTWYSVDEQGTHSVSFNEDKTFELKVANFNFSSERLKSKNLKMISRYETIKGNINKINLTINLIHPDTTFNVNLRGIYEFKNDSTLKLDFRFSNQSEIQEFTSESMVFKNNLKHLKSTVKEESKGNNYIFRYNKNGKIIEKNVKLSDSGFAKIDSLIKKK